jgi:cobalt-zinc-cadmium efflux system outer membrane protein
MRLRRRENVVINLLPVRPLSGWRSRLGCLCALAWVLVGGNPGLAEPPPARPEPEALTLPEAVQWALQNNPELATLRQQHGIAAAAVVIAQTYPFNPVWDGKFRATTGPAEAGITNPLSNEHKLLLEVEVRGQGRHRRQAAQAALSRTEWEIAFQEVALAVRVVRAFNAVLYRYEKLRLIEETVQVNEEAAQQVRKLVQSGRLRPADFLVVRSDLNDARTQVSGGRAALAAAWSDLRRALGSVNGAIQLHGFLDVPSPQWDAETLVQAALERRADLHAREAAVAEADARLRLEVANRYGNPNVGPDYEIDAARVSNIGAQITVPLPVFNTRRGEILQRQAERSRAALEFQQAEVLVCHDVQAALARLEEAQAGVALYRTQVLPDAQSAREEIELLYGQGEPGVDLPRVVEFRRKLLKARDGYLDALLEMRQALADLAAAVGDPAPAFGSDLEADKPKAPSSP